MVAAIRRRSLGKFSVSRRYMFCTAPSGRHTFPNMICPSTAKIGNNYHPAWSSTILSFAFWRRECSGCLPTCDGHHTVRPNRIAGIPRRQCCNCKLGGQPVEQPENSLDFELRYCEETFACFTNEISNLGFILDADGHHPDRRSKRLSEDPYRKTYRFSRHFLA